VKNSSKFLYSSDCCYTDLYLEHTVVRLSPDHEPVVSTHETRGNEQLFPESQLSDVTRNQALRMPMMEANLHVLCTCCSLSGMVAFLADFIPPLASLAL